MTTPAVHPPPPPRDVDQAVARVREHGGRLTRAKREIIDLLHGESAPLSADAIVARLGDLDRSVIYRNLAQLEELGIAEHVHPGHGPAVYRPAGLPTVPVVCGACGTTRELERRHTGSFTRRVAELTGITVDLTHLPLTGTCDDCAERPS